MAKNVWSVGTDAIVESLVQQEMQRKAEQDRQWLLDERGRSLEDRDRLLSREDVENAREDSEHEYKVGRRAVVDPMSDAQAQLGMTSATQGIQQNAQTLDAGAADAETAALLRKAQQEFMANPRGPNRENLLATIAVLQGNQPYRPPVRQATGPTGLNPQVQQMIANAASQPGMNYELMMSTLQAAAPRILQQYPGTDLADVAKMATTLFPRPQQASGLEALMGEEDGTSAGPSREDIMGVMFGQPQGAAPGAAAAPAAGPGMTAANPFVQQALAEWAETHPGEPPVEQAIIGRAQDLSRANSVDRRRRSNRPSALEMAGDASGVMQ
jgi:hypothetical protein